jgi:hypothetical protein
VFAYLFENHMMGDVSGTQKEDDRGPLSIQSSLAFGMQLLFNPVEGWLYLN